MIRQAVVGPNKQLGIPFLHDYGNRHRVVLGKLHGVFDELVQNSGDEVVFLVPGKVVPEIIRSEVRKHAPAFPMVEKIQGKECKGELVFYV